MGGSDAAAAAGRINRPTSERLFLKSVQNWVICAICGIPFRVDSVSSSGGVNPVASEVVCVTLPFAQLFLPGIAKASCSGWGPSIFQRRMSPKKGCVDRHILARIFVTPG